MGNSGSSGNGAARNQTAEELAAQHAAALDTLGFSGEQYANEIRKLEGEHRAKLAEVTRLQFALHAAQQDHMAGIQRFVEEANKRRAEHLAMLEERNKERLAEFKKELERELDEKVTEVTDLIRVERRQMMREDVLAEVLRELDRAWALQSVQLRTRLEKQREIELGVSKATHEKMAREFVAKLAAEEEAARAEKRVESKKRGSSGIFSWLSPSKKNKAGGDGSDEDDSED